MKNAKYVPKYILANTKFLLNIINIDISVINITTISISAFGDVKDIVAPLDIISATYTLNIQNIIANIFNM